MQAVTFITILLNLLLPSAAHFLLNSPPTIGFDDDLESEAPCGSFKVDFTKDNLTEFHVGGDAIALTSIHPEATWLFRATLDQTASGNWTDLLPAVSQTGLGAYCEQAIVVPHTFAGSKGVIQVVQDAPDGILFQCSTVNFVAGSADSPPSSCKNVTGLSAKYTTDVKLSSLPATAAATSGSTSATTSSMVTSTTAPTPTSSSAKSDAYALAGRLGGFDRMFRVVISFGLTMMAALA